MYRATSTPVPTTGTPLNGATLLTSPSYTDATAVNGTTYHYVVVAVDASGNASAASSDVAATPTAAAGAALRFDGTNDYVTFGSAAALGATNFTLETWFRRTGAGVGVDHGHRRHRQRHPADHQGRRRGRDARQRQHELLPRHRRRHRRARGRLRGGPQAPQPPGHGHDGRDQQRLASRRRDYDAATGTLAPLPRRRPRPHRSRSAPPSSRSPRAIQHAALGSSLTSTGAVANSGGFFAGILDEARIWNVARTASQIAANRDHTLTSGTGLIARYGLDEGTGTTHRLERRGRTCRHAHERPDLDGRSGADPGLRRRQHAAGRRHGHDHPDDADDRADAHGQRDEP